MMEVITAIAVAVVPLLATWITSQVIPWLKARTTAEQRKTLMLLVRSAVRAAEQVFKNAQGDGTNAAKLAYAKAQVVADLEAAGEKIPEDIQLEGYIEAAVLELTIKQEWGMAEALEPVEETESVKPLEAVVTETRDGTPALFYGFKPPAGAPTTVGEFKTMVAGQQGAESPGDQ